MPSVYIPRNKRISSDPSRISLVLLPAGLAAHNGARTNFRAMRNARLKFAVESSHVSQIYKKMPFACGTIIFTTARSLFGTMMLANSTVSYAFACVNLPAARRRKQLLQS